MQTHKPTNLADAATGSVVVSGAHRPKAADAGLRPAADTDAPSPADTDLDLRLLAGVASPLCTVKAVGTLSSADTDAPSPAVIGVPSPAGIGAPLPVDSDNPLRTANRNMPPPCEIPSAVAAKGYPCPAFTLLRSARAVLPTVLQSAADGKAYRIDPCFRTVLACIKRMCDPDADDLKKLLYLARHFYLSHPPADLDRLFAAFVTGGQSGEDEPPLMDFELDAGAIYASFWQQYGIDLLSAELHWVAFRELLAGLTENTPLGARIRLRALPDDRVAPEDRALVRRLREKIAIAPKTGKAEQALLDELNRRLAAGENPADVLEKLREV